MANEAILREWQEDPIDFIVDDATGIEKGTILRLSGVSSRKVVATSGSDIDVAPAGIARREKIALDGRTRLAVFRKGIFDILLGGTCNVGDKVIISGVNTVRAGTIADLSGVKARVLGTTLEDGAHGEVIQIAVNL